MQIEIGVLQDNDDDGDKYHDDDDSLEWGDLPNIFPPFEEGFELCRLSTVDHSDHDFDDGLDWSKRRDLNDDDSK